jgi:acetolactate synthase-1/3 small subunit
MSQYIDTKPIPTSDVPEAAEVVDAEASAGEMKTEESEVALAREHAAAKGAKKAAHPAPRSILELTVKNHPGVMSHVSGLFARRAYNVEGILCMPIGAGAQSRIWLMVNEDERLEQMVKQLEKLEDIIKVNRHGADHRVFEQLEEYFKV